MKQLKNKLGNSRGASLIIAMVFMLICLFVGGSVLVAASMNTHRMKQVDPYQNFLNQRSAAMLIADELRTKDGEPLGLIIRERKVTTQPLTIQPSGKEIPTGTASSSFTVEFEVVTSEGTELTEFQRTAYETTILSYLQKKGIHPQMTPIKCINFKYGESEIKDYSTFWLTYTPPDPSALPGMEGTYDGEVKVNIQGEFGAEAPAPYLARFKSDVGANRFDYVVDFDNSQLEVRMNASTVGTTVPPAVEEIIYDSRTSARQVVTTIEITPIVWSQPEIGKAGA